VTPFQPQLKVSPMRARVSVLDDDQNIAPASAHWPAVQARYDQEPLPPDLPGEPARVLA
jgi:hypothetical protein